MQCGFGGRAAATEARKSIIVERRSTELRKMAQEGSLNVGPKLAALNGGGISASPDDFAFRVTHRNSSSCTLK